MNPTYTEIKSAARSSLKHRWAEAVAAALVFISVSVLDTLMQYLLMTVFKVDAVWSPFSDGAFTDINAVASICITLFSAVYSVLIVLPLFFGVVRWFWMVTGGGDPSLGEIFCYFSEGKLFSKSLLISFGLFWRAVLASVICYLPAILFNLLLTAKVYNYFDSSMPVWLSGMYPLVGMLRFLGTVALLFYMVRYLMFYEVLFAEPELTAHKTIKRSLDLTRGRRMKLVGFMLSFIGWALLSAFGLPMLFTVPFAIAAMTVYGREEYRSYIARRSASY